MRPVPPKGYGRRMDEFVHTVAGILSIFGWVVWILSAISGISLEHPREHDEPPN
jgi:hypothetical protein